MSEYRCTLIGPDRKRIVRTIEADSEQALLQKTKELGYFLLEKEPIVQPKRIVRSLSNKDLIIFCRQMSVMIQSGITVIRAISILQEKTSSARAKRVYINIYEMLQKGNSLSASMDAQNVFPEMLVNMVAAGESSGILETNLAKMAENYEKENRLNNKIKGAMVYPIILAIASVAVTIFLITAVMPSLIQLFNGHELPWTTRVLIAITDFLMNYWTVILFVLIILVAAIPIINKIPAVRSFLDRTKLKLPYFGKLNRTIYSARCARSFASLYASGIDIISLLRMIARIIGNSWIEEQFESVVQKVSRGEYISTSMEDLKVFDPMLTSMIYIGEESGSIDAILGKAADYFDEEADTASTRMTQILEPVMIIIMAFVVGFIMIAIMSALYGSYQYIA